MKATKDHSLSPPIIPLMGKTMKHINALLVAKLSLAGVDLTKNQVILLRRISEGPKPQSSLALITERDKGCLTRLIQSMEKKGLVLRVVSKEDKREKYVKLTPEGERELNVAMPILEDCFDLLLEGITEKERVIARKVLTRIMENADQDIECNC